MVNMAKTKTPRPKKRTKRKRRVTEPKPQPVDDPDAADAWCGMSKAVTAEMQEHPFR